MGERKVQHEHHHIHKHRHPGSLINTAESTYKRTTTLPRSSKNKQQTKKKKRKPETLIE